MLKILSGLLWRMRGRRPGEAGVPMIAPRARVDGSCRLGRYVNIAAGAQVARGSEIGLRTSVGRDAKLQNAHVGRYCSISWNVTIGAPAHPFDHLTTHAFTCQRRFGIVDGDCAMPRPPAEALVGNDVWIGCHAVILSGVAVGDGAVVGAGSVVTHDVPPYAIVAGVPARVLRYRFPPDVIARLLALQWWNLPDVKIRELVAAGAMGVVSDKTLALAERIATS